MIYPKIHKSQDVCVHTKEATTFSKCYLHVALTFRSKGSEHCFADFSHIQSHSVAFEYSNDSNGDVAYLKQPYLNAFPIEYLMAQFFF